MYSLACTRAGGSELSGINRPVPLHPPSSNGRSAPHCAIEKFAKNLRKNRRDYQDTRAKNRPPQGPGYGTPKPITCAKKYRHTSAHKPPLSCTKSIDLSLPVRILGSMGKVGRPQGMTKDVSEYRRKEAVKRGKELDHKTREHYCRIYADYVANKGTRLQLSVKHGCSPGTVATAIAWVAMNMAEGLDPGHHEEEIADQLDSLIAELQQIKDDLGDGNLKGKLDVIGRLMRAIEMKAKIRHIMSPITIDQSKKNVTVMMPSFTMDGGASVKTIEMVPTPEEESPDDPDEEERVEDDRGAGADVSGEGLDGGEGAVGEGSDLEGGAGAGGQ